ncbi:MAG: S8 family serine peptidase [Mastigocoleus sp.]
MLSNNDSTKNLTSEGLNLIPNYTINSLDYINYSNEYISKSSSIDTNNLSDTSDYSGLNNFNDNSNDSSNINRNINTQTSADLIVNDALIPSEISIGSTVKLSYEVSNLGTDNAGIHVVGFYLSEDMTLSSDDTILGASFMNNDGIGSSEGESEIDISSDIVAGEYYLILQADGLNTVEESNENNNIFVNKVTITSDAEDIIPGYDPSSGYGLIDASNAVSQASGEDDFDDVPDLGGNNWGADSINAPEVWDEGYTGDGVVVAVLDTGVDYQHEDLKDNIWINSGEIADNGRDDDGNGYIDDVYGWNFDADNNNTLDVNGHGTHVAGTIAAADNDFGATGIAYNADIMPVKVLNDEGSGYYSSIADGIYYAVDNGADVINMSLGGDSSDRQIESAIEYAHNNGVTVVMAAGNSGDSNPIYPASYADEYGIAVGAVDEDGELASFSNRSGNSEITYVTAPGVNIYSTLPGDSYGSYSGTSMATPHVSGVVALMLDANSSLTPDQIREIIADSSQNTQEESSNILATSTSDSRRSLLQ